MHVMVGTPDIARKYREIAADLIVLAHDVGTVAERDICIAFSSYCLSSARALEDQSKLAGALRGGARGERLVRPGGRRTTGD